MLSGGPIINGYHNGGLSGSGTIVCFVRQELAAGRIDDDGFLKMVASGAPSAGYCSGAWVPMETKRPRRDVPANQGSACHARSLQHIS